MSQKTEFIPDPDQMIHKPETSGNEINGLGEENFRQPDIVYWADDTSTIPHGKMQNWFYEKNMTPSIMAARAKREIISNIKPKPVAKEKYPTSTKELKDYAQEIGTADCGITAFKADWCYKGREVTGYPNVIALALYQNYNEMISAPEDTAGAEVIRVYGEGTRIAKTLANWIRDRGYNAKESAGPMAGNFTMIPAAIKAGLGELGKHGSIIHPRLGSNFRLACVLTDMPLDYDQPLKFGADGFCEKCQICTRDCPPDAIFKTKQSVRGKHKWYVDFDACIPFFNEHAGCGICITVCPWSRPGVADKMLKKLGP